MNIFKPHKHKWMLLGAENINEEIRDPYLYKTVGKRPLVSIVRQCKKCLKIKQKLIEGSMAEQIKKNYKEVE